MAELRLKRIGVCKKKKIYRCPAPVIDYRGSSRYRGEPFHSIKAVSPDGRETVELGKLRKSSAQVYGD